MSVVRGIVGGGASVRGEWDRIMSDISGIDAGPREMLPSTRDGSGMAGEPGITPEVWNLLAQFFSQEGLSPLVARLIRSAQQENPAEEKVPPDAEARWQQLLSPQGALTHIPVPGMAEPVMVCFLCGLLGHGVSRCSRMYTAFPFFTAGILG